MIEQSLNIVVVTRRREAELVGADALDDIAGFGHNSRKKIDFMHGLSLGTARGHGLEEKRHRDSFIVVPWLAQPSGTPAASSTPAPGSNASR
ncbi:hypothetical protein GCM10023075_54730 [Streptosporangium album]